MTFPFALRPPESNPFHQSAPANPLCPAQERCLRRVTPASEDSNVAHALTWISCCPFTVEDLFAQAMLPVGNRENPWTVWIDLRCGHGQGEVPPSERARILPAVL